MDVTCVDSPMMVERAWRSRCSKFQRSEAKAYGDTMILSVQYSLGSMRYCLQ